MALNEAKLKDRIAYLEIELEAERAKVAKLKAVMTNALKENGHSDGCSVLVYTFGRKCDCWVKKVKKALAELEQGE